MIIGFFFNIQNLRAVVVVTTEEHSLPSVVTETVFFGTRYVTTFSVIGSDTSLEILR